MISPHLLSHCMSARPYYYDFLSEQTRGNIPESALEHMIQCANCQGEIDRLRTLFERLDRKESSGPSQRDLAIGELLKLHFAHLDEQVKCGTAKLFLADLADPVLQIRTLTPITKHIDRCRACRDDLLSLQELQLTRQQLCRLGRLLADELGEETAGRESYSRARPAIDSAESMVLRETVDNIARRPDSGVVTRFTLHEQIDEGIGRKSGDRRPDWRISAQAHGQKEFAYLDDVETPPATALPARKRTISVVKLKRCFKPALAVAAVIAIASTLFFATSVLQGTASPEFTKSFDNVRNVCTTIFPADGAEPTQTRWKSQALNVHLVDTRGEYVLFNIESGIKKTRLSPSGPIETEKMSPDLLARMKDGMSNSFGLLPVSRIRDFPEGAKWRQVDTENLETAVEGIEVFDLTWTRGRLARPLSFNRLRLFVDANTDLPKRTEFYSRHGSETEYTLDSFTTVTYPTDAEIEEAIRSRFGQ